MADPLLGFTLAQEGVNLAPGVPQVPTQTTSGGGTSPGNGGTSTNAFSANIAPSVKKNFQIKEKLLRPALTSHYQCWFNPPGPVLSWLTQKGLSYSNNAELISLSCSEASLPGSSFMTNEITDDYTGVTERHAYRRAYDDRSDFTFYVDHARPDGNYNVLWFFEKWMQYIANEQDAFGLDTREFYHRVRFPEDYYTDNLFINKFERDFDGQYLQYKFMQAYPISLNSIPVSYDSSQLLKVTVSFTYTRYLTKRSNNEFSQEPGGQPTAPGVPPISTTEGDQINIPLPPTTTDGRPVPQLPVTTAVARRIGTSPGQVNAGGGNIIPPSNSSPEDFLA